MLPVAIIEEDSGPPGTLGGPTSQPDLGLGAAMPSFKARCDTPPQAQDLADWDQHYFSLDAHLATKLGFGFGVMSAGARQRIIVLEFSRSAPCIASDGTELRYGVSVRLVVRVSNYEAGANLALPFVAAEAQMGHLQTESTLAVRGYAGQGLAGLIPPLQSLTVDTYVDLMQRISKIQDLLGRDIANVRPALLQVPETAVEGPNRKVEHAVGLVWALSKIADGVSRNQAIADFPSKDSEASTTAIQDAYADAYAEAMGTDSTGDEAPPAPARAWANGYLAGQRLGRSGARWFGR
jgi:hypothetical protein